MKKVTRAQSGFTLLEVVLVMGIMAFLTINIAINLQNAFSARNRIQTKVADFSKIRDSLRIMERDINLAFHYRDLETEFRTALKKAQTPSSSTQAPPQINPMTGLPMPPGFTQPPTSTMPATDPKDEERKRNRLDPVTQFVGTESSMDFATTNSTRMAVDQKQANFVKVGYKLGSCRRPGAEASTQCVLRREDPLVEGKIVEGGIDSVLLEDVTEFKLRYFGKGKQDWNSDWNSEAGDAVTKDNYPQAVEISITTESGPDGKKRKVSMQIVASVRFPNNAEKQGQQQTGVPESQ